LSWRKREAIAAQLVKAASDGAVRLGKMLAKPHNFFWTPQLPVRCC